MPARYEIAHKRTGIRITELVENTKQTATAGSSTCFFPMAKQIHITEKPRRSTRNRSLWSVDGLYEIVGGLGKKLDLGDGLKGWAWWMGDCVGWGGGKFWESGVGDVSRGENIRWAWVAACDSVYTDVGVIRIRQTLEGKRQWTSPKRKSMKMCSVIVSSNLTMSLSSLQKILVDQ